MFGCNNDHLYPKKYRKILKVSPGALFEGRIFGGAFIWRETGVSKSIGLAL